MSTTGSEDRRAGAAAQGGDAPPERNEVSGLHDIRALARTTIQRHQERHPDDLGEVVDSLLATASPASLGSVLLPEPGREVKPAAVVAIERAERGGGGWGKTIFFSAAVLVAGGAVAFVMHRNAQQKQQQVLAMAPTGADRVTASAGPSGAGPEVTPIERPPAAPAQVEEAKAVPVSDTPGAAATPPAADRGAADKAPGAKADKALPKDKDTPRDKAAGGAATDANKDKVATPPPATAPAEPPADKPPPKAEPNIDDLFGGAPPPPVDEPEDKPAEAAPAEQLPLKLAPDQVKKGMRSVTPRVSDCFTRYKVPGTVTIKVKIEGDGTVSSAIAVDKFANTETGFCVAEAVALAKFPKFSGPPMQINYPFKLQ